MDEAEDLTALVEEFQILGMPGHDRRRGFVMEWLQREGEGLMLGTIADEKERERAIGRCQALKGVLDRDTKIREAYEEHVREEQMKAEQQDLEGGNYGVHYEAAQ